ncbi:MAG: hypothetical protein ACM3ZE_05965, partial [Myxococcales bacterium]
MHAESAREERITSHGLSKGQIDLIFATGGDFCELAERWLGQTGYAFTGGSLSHRASAIAIAPCFTAPYPVACAWCMVRRV